MAHRTWAVRLVRVAAIAAGLYVLVLLAVSFTSSDRVLAPGVANRFCGFYLDCHRMAAVDRAEYRDAIGDRRPGGRFLVVTVRLVSDAYGVTLKSGRLAAVLRDAGGTTYGRDVAAEDALAVQRDTTVGLPNVTLPGGQPVLTRIVFDVPLGIDAPRLRIRDADPLAALIEFFLIGDEDSMRHGRTWFALPVPASPAVETTTARVCGITSGCDTVVRVVRVQREVRAGEPPTGVPADGIFYLVTLAVSEADSGAPRSAPLVAVVRDADGRSFARAVDVESLIRGRRSRRGVVRLAFDLPDDVIGPRLVLRKPGLLNRLFLESSLPLPAGG